MSKPRLIAAIAGAALLIVAAGTFALFSSRNSSSNRSTEAGRMAIFDNSFRAIEDGERRAPRDRWDPEYVVATVGNGPVALFHWVQSNTMWIPYHGILRDAVGVLMDRQGNSIDRSLLLARLLSKAGHRVRLAHAALDEETAEKLLAHLPASHPFPADPVSISARDAKAAAEHYHLDGDRIESAITARMQSEVAVAHTVHGRIIDQTRRILGAVRRPAANAEWKNRLRDALDARADHWWVQLDSSGTWIDFDVDAPVDSARIIVPAQETHDLNDVPSLGLHHEIAIRVITEQWSSGSVTEHKVLEHVIRPADVIGQSVVLQFLPARVIDNDSATSDPVSAIRAAAAEQTSWHATLTVGTNVVSDATILSSAAGPEAAAQRGGFFSLGAAVASAASASAEAGSVLSAAWIEYEIRVPGREPRKVRRMIFDLIGPAARAQSIPLSLELTREMQLDRSYALSMRTEILPISCRISRNFVTHLVAQSALQNREVLRRALLGLNASAPDSVSSGLVPAAPFVSSLYGVGLSRFDWTPQPDRIFIDSPNLITNHVYPSHPYGKTGISTAIDIVANEVGVSLAVRDAFAARVMQGILDTNAESFLLPDAARHGNTGDAFAENGSWLAIESSAALQNAGLALPDDVKDRIASDISGNYIAVAPHQSVKIDGDSFAGWWRIDRQSGTTLGMGPNGWGQGVSEDAVVRQPSTSSPVVGALKAAGQRAFVAFHWGGGICLIQAIDTKLEKKKSLWAGMKAVVVEDQNECVAQGVFWAAIAAVPLTLPMLASQLRLSSAEAAAVTEAGEVGQTGSNSGQVAGEAAGEGSGTAGSAGEAGGAEGAAPGESPQAQSVEIPKPSAPEGQGEPDYVPPPPRALKDIEADIDAANKEYEAARNKYDVENDAFMKERSAAKKAGQPIPEEPVDLTNDFIDMLDKWTKVDQYKYEYLQNGGALDRAGNPAGKFEIGEIGSEVPSGPKPQGPGIPGASPLASSAAGLDGLMGINK